MSSEIQLKNDRSESDIAVYITVFWKKDLDTIALAEIETRIKEMVTELVEKYHTKKE